MSFFEKHPLGIIAGIFLFMLGIIFTGLKNSLVQQCGWVLLFVGGIFCIIGFIVLFNALRRKSP